MSVGWIFSTCHKNWLTSENVAYWFWVEDGFLIAVKLGITMIKPFAATNKCSEKKWYGVFRCWKKLLWKGTEVHIYSNLFESSNNCNIWDSLKKILSTRPHIFEQLCISHVNMLVFLHVIFMLISVFVCAVLVLFVLYLYPVSVEMSAAWFHDLLCSKVISSGVSIPVYCGVIYTLGMSCLRH